MFVLRHMSQHTHHRKSQVKRFLPFFQVHTSVLHLCIYLTSWVVNIAEHYYPFHLSILKVLLINRAREFFVFVAQHTVSTYRIYITWCSVEHYSSSIAGSVFENMSSRRCEFHTSTYEAIVRLEPFFLF